MLIKLKRLYGDRRGITGLETAIILIAFVVVASVFAYTVISAGIFSSHKEKEALHAGLEEARTLMVPKGDVTAYKYPVDTTGDDVGDTDGVVKVSFTVTTGLAELPIDLTPAWQLNATNGNLETSGLANPVVVSYSDSKQLIEDAAWTVSFSGKSNGDNVLESEEKAEITVWVVDYQYVAVPGLHYSLGAGPADPFIDAAADLLGARTKFTMQIKGEKGATVVIERTLPVRLNTVMNLN